MLGQTLRIFGDPSALGSNGQPGAHAAIQPDRRQQLAAAWLISEVSGTLSPLFGFGDTPARTVAILLAIGFPLFLNRLT